MTQAPDEREMLARDLCAAEGADPDEMVEVLLPIEADHVPQWEHFASTADKLLSLGWCRREAVLREAGQAPMDARKALLMVWDGEDYEYQEGSVADALRIIDAALLTPQARKEGE